MRTLIGCFLFKTNFVILELTFIWSFPRDFCIINEVQFCQIILEHFFQQHSTFYKTSLTKLLFTLGLQGNI